MVRPPPSPHKGPPCLLPHPRGRACRTAALPIAHNHCPRRIRPRNAWALGDLKARSVRWTSTTPRVLAATPVMRARWPHRGNQMAQQQTCCRHTEDSPSRSPRHPAGPPGPSPGSGHTKTLTQCWTAWQPRLRRRTLMMKLTFPGHRGGARVPPEYVDKFPSPLDCVSCSGTLRSTCSEKVIGSASRLRPGSLSTPGCLVSVRAVPGLPTLFSIHDGNYVWSLDPDVRLQCTNLLLLHFSTVTSPRAPGAGSKDQTSVDYMFQASFFCAYIQQFLSLSIILTESWDGPRYLTRPARG